MERSVSTLGDLKENSKNNTTDFFLSLLAPLLLWLVRQNQAGFKYGHCLSLVFKKKIDSYPSIIFIVWTIAILCCCRRGPEASQTDRRTGTNSSRGGSAKHRTKQYAPWRTELIKQSSLHTVSMPIMCVQYVAFIEMNYANTLWRLPTGKP